MPNKSRSLHPVGVVITMLLAIISFYFFSKKPPAIKSTDDFFYYEEANQQASFENENQNSKNEELKIKQGYIKADFGQLPAKLFSYNATFTLDFHRLSDKYFSPQSTKTLNQIKTNINEVRKAYQKQSKSKNKIPVKKKKEVWY
jgi:hypothetical protein